MLPHPLTNFKIQKYYQNEPNLMVFLQEIVCNEYESIGSPWIATYVDDNNVTYFDSFGIEHI